MESVCEEYPKEILPRITFKYTLNIDKLLKKYPMLIKKLIINLKKKNQN